MNAGQVAAAAMSQLDGSGAVLTWIDADGSHADRIRFPATADRPAMLASLLRGQVDPASTDGSRPALGCERPA